MNKYSELMVYFKKKGLKDTIARIKSRYFSINEFVLFRNDLKDTSSMYQLIPDVEYRTGTLEELIEYRNEHIDLPREFYIDQTHGGKEFYLGFYKGELAQICWVFRKGEYSRFFTFKDDSSCEVNYIITLPQYRGKGISAYILNYICDKLAKEEIKVAVGGIATGNVLMVKGMKSTGFYEFKRVKSYFSYINKTYT